MGVRQSFKHGTITIAEDVTNLPFDVAGKGTLEYHPKNYIMNEKFRIEFKEAIKDCLQNPDRPDSKVLEIISGRGTLFEIFRIDEAIRRLDAVISECDKNLQLLGRIVNKVHFNQQNKNKHGFIAYRFRLIAIELLITNRYVYEEKTFSDSAENCWNDLYAMNDRLNYWEIFTDSTEKFILKVEKETWQNIANFKGKVEVARDIISKRL